MATAAIAEEAQTEVIFPVFKPKILWKEKLEFVIDWIGEVEEAMANDM